MDKLWYLKRCDIFHGLSKPDLDKVGAIAHERTIPKKEIIYALEDKNEVMFILKKGRVRIFKLSSEGKMMTLVILKDGDIFGSMSLIKGGVSKSYAETLMILISARFGRKIFTILLKICRELPWDWLKK